MIEKMEGGLFLIRTDLKKLKKIVKTP